MAQTTAGYLCVRWNFVEPTSTTILHFCEKNGQILDPSTDFQLEKSDLIPFKGILGCSCRRHHLKLLIDSTTTKPGVGQPQSYNARYPTHSRWQPIFLLWENEDLKGLEFWSVHCRKVTVFDFLEKMMCVWWVPRLFGARHEIALLPFQRFWLFGFLSTFSRFITSCTLRLMIRHLVKWFKTRVPDSCPSPSKLVPSSLHQVWKRQWSAWAWDNRPWFLFRRGMPMARRESHLGFLRVLTWFIKWIWFESIDWPATFVEKWPCCCDWKQLNTVSSNPDGSSAKRENEMQLFVGNEFCRWGKSTSRKAVTVFLIDWK